MSDEEGEEEEADEEGEFDVFVRDQDREPVEGTKVHVIWDGILSGFETQYTDNEGHAKFFFAVRRFRASDSLGCQISVEDYDYDEHHDIENGDGITIDVRVD